MSYGYNENEDSDEKDNPLMAGLWMDDDSLAPPCGCEMEFIPWMLEVAAVQSVRTKKGNTYNETIDGHSRRLTISYYRKHTKP